MTSTALIGSLPGAVPSVHPDAWIAPGAVVVGSVRIGAASSVWYGSVLRADEDEIVIGDGCNIQDLCCLHVDPGEPVVLEDRVSVGHHATVHGAYVETGALIGIGAVVLGKARVGARSLVAAGAVIRPGMAVPPGVLVAGVPGKVLRELTADDYATFDDTPEGYMRRAVRHAAASWNPPQAS